VRITENTTFREFQHNESHIALQFQARIMLSQMMNDI